MLNKRFNKLLERYGCKTQTVPAYIDRRPTKRPDILAVHKHKKWVLTIPKKIYVLRGKLNLDLGKRPQLNFQMCQKMLREKRFAYKGYIISLKEYE